MVVVVVVTGGGGGGGVDVGTGDVDRGSFER